MQTFFISAKPSDDALPFFAFAAAPSFSARSCSASHSRSKSALPFENSFAFVLVEGLATLSEELPALRYWAARIGGRYMGAEVADRYGERNGVPGELLVRVKPRHVVAQTGITD